MILLEILCGLLIWVAHGSADPTEGFTQLDLSAANFNIQRYSFIHGVHSMWVYNDDKPLSNHSNTKPRTEIQITGYDYTTGVRQFEGDFYVPRGTSGTCIMQVFGAPGMVHATALQLRVYDGQLKHYKDDVVASDVYDRWIHLNVIHDADEEKVNVFIDGEEKIIPPISWSLAGKILKFGPNNI
ncbi:hypothetical protein SUGI_1021820 [Cryptomeria japonica]|nr:hypothetical protein SUGI_1021820 [Cryptomeria japonica]